MTAFLLEELEENTINETVRAAFNSQIMEFTSDMKLLVEDVNSKIEDHLRITMEKLARASSSINSQAHRTDSDTTYASALIKPPPHVNPRIAAREGIKACQFLLMGIKESAYGQLNSQKLKAKLNKTA